MKTIIELSRAIQNQDFYFGQFNDSTEKNILYINPMLTGKQLYQVFFPYISMCGSDVYTSITKISKYNPKSHILDIGEINIGVREIIWADYIVFPFTTTPLSEEDGWYSKIRSLNPFCRIIFNVDFNFFEIPEGHPYRNIFTEENTRTVIDNMRFSDITFTNNYLLRNYLDYILNKIKESKKQVFTDVSYYPIVIDAQIALQNVDYDVLKPEVIKRAIVNKIEKIASKIKEKNIREKILKKEKYEKKIKEKTNQKPKAGAVGKTKTKNNKK